MVISSFVIHYNKRECSELHTVYCSYNETFAMKTVHNTILTDIPFNIQLYIFCSLRRINLISVKSERTDPLFQLDDSDSTTETLNIANASMKDKTAPSATELYILYKLSLTLILLDPSD